MLDFLFDAFKITLEFKTLIFNVLMSLRGERLFVIFKNQ